MIRQEELEASFVQHMRRLRPDEQAVADFPKIAEQVWRDRAGSAEANAERLRTILEEQRRLKSRLLLAKLRGEVNQADYAQANSEFDCEIGCS